MIRKLLSQKQILELARYGVGGCSTMVVCWGTCISLVELFSIHYIISNNIATVFAWIYAYFVNKYFVFRNRERKHLNHGSKFFILQASLLALANLLLYIEVEYFGWHYIVSLAVMTVIVTILNYSFMKLFVFDKPQESTP